MDENQNTTDDEVLNGNIEKENINWEEFIKRYWIYLLGGLFLFTALLFLLKLAIEEGWITPISRTILGYVIGFSILALGYLRYQKHKNLMSALITSTGSVILFSTVAYAAYSPEVPWSIQVLIISLLAVTIIVTWLAIRSQLRILGFLAVVCGIIVPFTFKPAESQVYLIFIYALSLNIASIFLSSKQKWLELRLTSFVLTAILYLTYYIYFDPQTWNGPVIYLTFFFLVYFFGLVLSSIYEHNFEGMNLYMGLLNAIYFLFWSLYIFNTFSAPYFVPISISGLLFLISSVIIYKKSQKEFLPSAVQFLIGIVFIATAGDNLASLFKTGGLNYVMETSIWLGLVILIFYCSSKMKYPIGKEIGAAALFIVLILWFMVAWDVEWVRWFGVEYIPFINPGALVWTGIAITGFVFSRKMVKNEFEDQESYSPTRANVEAIILAITSHLVVGGLLTIQIQNTWEVYNLSFLGVDVFLSVSWMIYALLLFLWGAFSNQNTFRWFGSVVLVITSIKVFVFDLSESSTLNMILFLVVLGILTLAIANIDKQWRKKHAQ